MGNIYTRGNRLSLKIYLVFLLNTLLSFFVPNYLTGLNVCLPIPFAKTTFKG